VSGPVIVCQADIITGINNWIIVVVVVIIIIIIIIIITITIIIIIDIINYWY